MRTKLRYVFILGLFLLAAPAVSYAQNEAVITGEDVANPEEGDPVSTTEPAQAVPTAETEAPAPTSESAPVPESVTEETLPELPKKAEFTDEPQIRIRILDKVRAESRTYDLDVGHTVAYANIRIRPRACRKSSPLDDPENAGFLQIWEVKPDKTSSWIFSGWMFSSSPSLSAMDHAVYDVTVLECRNPKAESQPESQPKAEEPKPKEEPAPVSKSETEKAIDEYIGDDTATDDTAEDPASEPAAEESTATDTAVPSSTPTNETPSAASAPASSE